LVKPDKWFLPPNFADVPRYFTPFIEAMGRDGIAKVVLQGVRSGKNQERLTSVVEKITGRKPGSLQDYIKSNEDKSRQKGKRCTLK
jgi:hypothetical protein